MPRPNRARPIAIERSLALRIAHERETRGMSYEGLALRMEKAGCPIQASAIYKIEKGDPPRRITVDELVALGRVFEMELADLIVDPKLDAAREFRVLVHAVLDSHDRAEAAVATFEDAVRDLQGYAKEHPNVVAPFEGDEILQRYLSTEV